MKTAPAAEFGTVVGPDEARITLKVNGEKRTLTLDPRTTLLDALRDSLDLTGSKRVCNKGQCGACTVILDGRTVLACSMLAVDVDGSTVVTIEGLAGDDELHPLQKTFVENDALQCGFCTPGFIMSGAENVTGRAKYRYDIQLPGMLFGRVLRSLFPHARVVSVDVS